jgi:hypothetical protein
MESLTDLDVDADIEIKEIIKKWGVRELNGFN